MKTTKTIEIEICDLCGAEQSQWHTFVCAGCLQTKHKCCENNFAVTVVHALPTPASAGKLRLGISPRAVGSTTCSHPEQYQFEGSFCEECEPRMSRILAVSGLQKKKSGVEQRVNNVPVEGE